MLDWLTKIDPNTIIGLGGLIAALATWTYHKIRGEKVDSFTDTITGLGKQAIHDLLADPTISASVTSDELTAKATAALKALAAKVGVPSNAVTDAIILATTQHVIGDVLAELRAAAGLQDQVAQLSAQVSSFAGSLAKTEADAFAKGKAWADENVEVIPSDGPAELPQATALPSSPTPTK